MVSIFKSHFKDEMGSDFQHMQDKTSITHTLTNFSTCTSLMFYYAMLGPHDHIKPIHCYLKWQNLSCVAWFSSSCPAKEILI